MISVEQTSSVSNKAFDGEPYTSPQRFLPWNTHYVKRESFASRVAGLTSLKICLVTDVASTALNRGPDKKQPFVEPTERN